LPFEQIVERNNQFYRDRLRSHGPTPKGADYNSFEAMALRFEQLRKIHDDDGPFVINDYGCGYGAFYDWMSARGLPFRYRGFDISDDMITHARQLHMGRENCVFVTRESDLTEADYTVASGVFNLRFELTDDDWLAYILDTLNRLAAMSRRGFAFNALTKYSDPERMRGDLYYADPCFLFDYCKRHFSRRVALLHDYPLWDFTILVRTAAD
jgi:SAM-dependent methyltransferase